MSNALRPLRLAPPAFAGRACVSLTALAKGDSHPYAVTRVLLDSALPACCCSGICV